MLLDNDNKESTTPVKKVRDHRGEKNPHFGHIMKPTSKEAIARSQKARYEFYKKAASNIMTEGRVREIIQETINDYLAKNALENKNNRTNNIPL